MDELKSGDSGDALRQRQCLSALADGEARQDEVASACAAWRDDAQARADWHAYALIGDVLRSDDLARGAGADAAFLACLRDRMVHEPVVLAPADVVPARPVAVPTVAAAGARSVRQWGTPMAMAAGVLTVIGVAAVMRGVAVPEASVTLAAAPVASAAVVPASAGPLRQVDVLVGQGEVAAVPVDPAVSAFVRDPEIDRYLNAHRQYARGLVLATPGGVRQVAASPAGR